MIKAILKNPITLWIRWFLVTRKLLVINRKKHLQIGYMTNLNKVSFGFYNTFYEYITIGNTTIGDFVYVASNTNISNCTIGKFCSIGSNVKIGLGIHPTNYLSTFPAFFSTRKQCQITFSDKTYIDELGSNKIGNDVWIGDNVIILSNLKIGDGAIVAAGSVVTKDVAPYSIVGGVPSKHIKFRFSETKIQEILGLRWWDRDMKWLKENHSYFIKPLDS